MDDKELYHYSSMAEFIREHFSEAAHDYMAAHTDQPDYCTYFGCGRILSITEQLYGNRCHDHSIADNIDINKHINIKQ